MSIPATEEHLGNYKQLEPNVKQAILRAHHYAEIPVSKRTDTEEQEFRECKQVIVDAANQIITDACATEMERMVTDFEEFERWDAGGVVLHLKALDDVLDKNRVPVLEDGFANVSNIDRVLTEMYSARLCIGSGLEELEPTLYRWHKYEQKMEGVIKALVDFKNEWKSEALIAIFMPTGWFHKIRTLEEYVGRFKQRMKDLDKAYEILSRLMTLHIDAPAGDLVRTNPEAAAEAATQVNSLRKRERKPGARFGAKPRKSLDYQKKDK